MGRCLNDYSFGPQVHGCTNNDLDFTILFEDIVFLLTPCAALLLVLPARLLYLLRCALKARRSRLLLLKLVAISTLACLQLAQLLLYATSSETFRPVTPAISSIALLSTIAMCSLSFFEHTRSVRPSSLMAIFLVVSLALDAARVRTLWLRRTGTNSLALAGATLAAKLSVLFSELMSKRNSLEAAYFHFPPEATANFFDRAVFCWINSLLRRGTKTLLALGDLWRTDSALSTARLYGKLKRSIEQPWTIGRLSGGAHLLLFATIRATAIPFFQAIIPRLAFAFFKYLQPLLINRVTDIVSKRQGSFAQIVRIGLIGASGLVYTGAALSNSLYRHAVYRQVTMVRGMLVSSVYDASLHSRLPQSAKIEAITLASTDVDRICAGLENIHEIWANVLETGFGVYLLQQQIGVGCVAPLIVIILCTLGSASISSTMSKRQATWNAAVQKRIHATSATLECVKSIKFTGFASSRLQVLQRLRLIEIQHSQAYRVLISVMNVISNTPEILSPVIAFTIAIYTTEISELDIQSTFTALAAINLLCSSVAALLSSLPTFFSTLGCFKRIEDYIVIREREAPSLRNAHEASIHGQHVALETLEMQPSSRNFKALPAILTMADASFANDPSSHPFLKSITLEIATCNLTVVVGPTASGKSFLLRSVLGETILCRGIMTLNSSSIAYCDQDIWLPNKSIRDIITCNSIFDEEWYVTTLEACGLKDELDAFAARDSTLAEGGGSNFSGGQKQRISLCRAIYARKTLLILDDILSGLDEATAQRIFNNLFGPEGLCRKSRQTVILATHSQKMASLADQILMLQDGSLVFQGAPSAIPESLGLNLKSLEQKEQHELPPNVEDAPRTSSTAGRILENPTQASDAEDITRRIGDFAVYSYYLRTIGWRDLLTFMSMASIYVFLSKFPQIWLQWWVEGSLHLTRATSAGIYFGLAIGGLSTTGLTIGYYFVSIVPRFIIAFHTTLLDVVFSAPIKFLNTAGPGSLLNRFSQDMQLIDMTLPSATFTTAFGALFCIAEIVLICLGSRYMAAIIPLGLAFAYAVQRFYLLTSRQLRFLELEAKAPLYTAFIDTLLSLETVRAFGWGPLLRMEFFERLDLAQRPYYLLFCIQRWLNVVLDLFVAALATIFVAFALETKDVAAAGIVGVALVNVVSFNQSIANLVVSWTNLETSLGAIARLRAFARTPREPRGDGDAGLDADWPNAGAISIRDVTVSYGNDTAEVLRDVNLSIESGKNICLRGRTGSGKSTLLGLLLRLVEPSAGFVTIDGININNLSPSLLRDRIIGVSQEDPAPLGTLKTHLDPSSLYSDAALVQLLHQFDLNIGGSNGALSLDTDLSSVKLSAGQSQLLSLARAVLRRRQKTGVEKREGSGGLLLLDEATSKLDWETEARAMAILRSEFENWTVVSIVHRESLLESADFVVAVEDGRVRVERGEGLTRAPKSL